MKKILTRISTIIPAIALFAAVTSAQAACWFFFNQPELPASLKKFDK